ncbi:queuine tRNA-ribosyltransferase catalytic subunit 1 [Eurytemora carolleeae]|uniref:queuine tRNA-ribosyltransferase catalytic subunit 1 n=1 Tax=Eurytemora carolleeae TaxID=1294199 RepID=UPI000C778E8F|nr:queuine tRNA-ribosyltransferase catalytic subunit 1 [Eurytemora carolleeae]|eukprot:XP_023327802.1 queuine tRNA-ribosyltransferase catalytic subunit 1-like [Eurytemora affinis]
MCVGGANSALRFNIVAKCSTSRARVAEMQLPHSLVDTPVFMPVGTQGTLKGIVPQQLEALDCRIMLANTYHLGNRPGEEVLLAAGGLHKFMNWNRSLLTDSGGFQMVSLINLYSNIFRWILSMESKVYIMMQLDDDVDSTHTDADRFEEARHRTVRWLDRCIVAHKKPDKQNLFPIVQGGLDTEKRKDCAEQLTKRNVPGFAIGGLSGGEEKDVFWRIVKVNILLLLAKISLIFSREIQGWREIVQSCFLRNAGLSAFKLVYLDFFRFGSALVFEAPGDLNLKKSQFRTDFRPIDESCTCSTCTTYTRAYLHTIVTKEPSACHLITVHNVAHQLSLMAKARAAIKDGRFPDFVTEFMEALYPSREYPQWAENAFNSVGIELAEKIMSAAGGEGVH